MYKSRAEKHEIKYGPLPKEFPKIKKKKNKEIYELKAQIRNLRRSIEKLGKTKS